MAQRIQRLGTVALDRRRTARLSVRGLPDGRITVRLGYCKAGREVRLVTSMARVRSGKARLRIQLVSGVKHLPRRTVRMNVAVSIKPTGKSAITRTTTVRVPRR